MVRNPGIDGEAATAKVAGAVRPRRPPMRKHPEAPRHRATARAVGALVAEAVAKEPATGRAVAVSVRVVVEDVAALAAAEIPLSYSNDSKPWMPTSSSNFSQG